MDFIVYVKNVGGRRMAAESKRTCDKCGRLLKEQLNFYKKRNGEVTTTCKGCITMHIDNFDPETFTWILKELDYPYIPSIWTSIRNRAISASKNGELTGLSVLGRYIAQMKLKHNKDYSWADTAEIMAEEEKRLAEVRSDNKKLIAEEQDAEVAYRRGEITKNEYRTKVGEAELAAMAPPPAFDSSSIVDPHNPMGGVNPYEHSTTQYIKEKEEEDAAQLSDSDKRELSLKWGPLYKVSEWIQLENLYWQMKQSFDISDADTESVLLLCCKTYLKANQALDMGDWDSYQKLTKMYNDLRKSAKFTKAQVKDEKDEDEEYKSFGEIVAMCEKEGGFIPKFKADHDLDAIDKMITDMKEYQEKLINNDPTIMRVIENYIKKKSIVDDMKLNNEEMTDKVYAELAKKEADERREDEGV